MIDEGADWTQGVPAVLVNRCGTCAHTHYLPREACPRCGGTDLSRSRSTGAGVVVASTTVRRMAAGSSTNGPVGIALVDLDDGIRVMGRCPPGTAPGLRVGMEFVTDRHLDGTPSLVPHFRAAGR